SEGISNLFYLLSSHLGEAKLFIGPRASQLGPADFRLPGIMTIGTLAEAHQAIEFIRHQGEGSRDEKSGSHYARFRAIRHEWEVLRRARPAFEPARAAARNPVMRDPVDASTRVHVLAEPAASLLDGGNVCYEIMLRLLTALSDVVPSGPAAVARRQTICDQTLALMHTLEEVGGLLSGMKENPEKNPGGNAGRTVTASRTVLAFLSPETATLLMAERFGCVADRFERLAEQLPTLARHAGTMRRFSQHWSAEHDQRWPVASAPSAESPKETAMGTTAPPAPRAPDEARGRDVLLR
ncbi:MAG: ferritin-like domain-containing protein, partial [Rhizobacter sp.]